MRQGPWLETLRLQLLGSGSYAETTSFSEIWNHHFAGADITDFQIITVVSGEQIVGGEELLVEYGCDYMFHTAT